MPLRRPAHHDRYRDLLELSPLEASAEPTEASVWPKETRLLLVASRRQSTTSGAALARDEPQPAEHFLWELARVMEEAAWEL